MELNREQIIKASECCFSNGSCDGCPITELVDCRRTLERNFLALIKELTEENERLRAERDTFEINYKDLKYRNGELIKDAVAWEHECREWEFENTVLREALAKTKADTVRKMHELIKERCINGGIYPAFVANTIDQIAKEMLES